MTRPRWSWLLVVGALVGCKPHTGGGGPQPPPFPGREAKCGVAKSQSEPLIVEWPSASRAKLEALSKRGVVVVSYQGCEMRVLGHCRAPGQYAFTSTTRKRDVVSIHDADELYANIPTGAARLEAKLQSSGELNVTMTIVGRYEASEPFVEAKALVGDCAGATHVISGLTAGAFKFFAGVEAEIGGGVDVMGAGAGAKSASQSELLNEDGDEQACAKSTSADKAPPEGCGAILRVEVVPLGGPKKAAVDACVAGDAKDCTARCDKGDAASCDRLAALYAVGRGGVPVDRKKALALLQKACDRGSADGCAHLGELEVDANRGVAWIEAKAKGLFQQACDAGSADGCASLGNVHFLGKAGLAKDEAKALALFQKACDAGSAEGCERLALFHELGYGGLPKDTAKGAAMRAKACDDGSGWACCLAAREYYFLEDPPTAAADKAQAVAYAHKACDLGAILCCEDLALSYVDGDLGLPKDKGKARTFYERACKLDLPRACDEAKKLASP